MSFLLSESLTKNHINNQISRKEQDSFLAHHFRQISKSDIGRVSPFTSKGSLTIEAALAAPVFFLAILCLVYLLEMISIQNAVKSALHYAAKEIVREAYINPFILPEEMKQDIVECIGAERLERSIIYGGSNGIECNGSRVFGSTSIMELSVQYRFRIPVLMFRIPVGLRTETVRVKGWTGYDGGGFSIRNEETVYVTDYGVVYHTDPECTYLDLSIRPVGSEELSELRNDGGGKYYPCELCMRRGDTAVHYFVTESGNRYHKSLSCGGLKRTVYAVNLSDVYGRGGCSRCVK